MPDPIYAGRTVAQLFAERTDAERSMAKLRAAGFHDIRLSEHTPEKLHAAGFSRTEATHIADALARGETLLTVTADAGETDAAAAILRSKADAGERPSDTHVIPVRAEQLDVTKERTSSEARVHKELVVEEAVIRVPVRREELVIERDGAAPVRIPIEDENPRPETES